MPFCPFYFGVSSLKLNSRKKGTLIINGFLGNLGCNSSHSSPSYPVARQQEQKATSKEGWRERGGDYGLQGLGFRVGLPLRIKSHWPHVLKLESASNHQKSAS